MRSCKLRAGRAVLSLLIAASAHAETLPADNPLVELSLEDLMNVTVTASRRMQTIADAPSTVYIITAEDIERFGFVDLKDALKLVPGMIVEDASYGQLYGGQRGFTGTFNKTLIMLNGREMNNLLAGEAFIGPQFPLHNVKRIEVIAGPGSALYGANAFAGVINIITRTPDDDGANNLAYSYGANTTNLATMGLSRRFENADLALAARYKRSDGEDFSDYVSDLSRFNSAVFRASNGWSRLPDGQYYNSTTGQVFRTPKTHGDRFENPEEASFLDLSYVRRFDGEGALTPTEIYGGVDYYDMTTGHGLSKTQQLYYTGTDHREFLMAWLGGAKRFFEERLEARAEFRFTRERTWGNHTAVDRIPNYPDTLGATPGGGNPYGYPSADDDSNPATPYSPSLGQIEKMRGHWSNKLSPGSRRYFGEIQLAWEGDFADVPILNSLTGFGARPHHIILGLAVDRKEATTNPWSLAWPSPLYNSVFIAEHPPLSSFDRRPSLSSTKYGVYIQDQVGFWDDRVLLTAGVRYDHHRNDGGDYFSYGGIFNPRAGLNIRVTPEDTLKILFGKAFREATPFEDPGLRPERMTTWELGWIRRVDRLALTNQVNAYFNRATNYIINEPQRFPDGRVAYGYTNGGILEVFGVEEVLHWEPTTRTTLDLSYTFQDPWIHQRTGTSLGNPVEKFRLNPVPRHQANARVHWNPVDRIGLGWVTRWTGRVRNFDDPSQYGANANPIAYIPASVVHDATATIRFGKTAAADDGFRLSLTVNNLADEFYENSNNRFTSAFMENPTAFAQAGRSWTLKIDTRF
jgi:outer membrane receptor protein involved in Fe transport